MSLFRDAVDPARLGPLPHPPLIPETVLRRHHCHWPADHRFKAAARVLQSIWREDRGLAAGSAITSDGQRRRLGSRLTHTDGKAGANFITPQIAEVAWRELVYREPGALFDIDRLRTNLLTSQAVCLNAFALLKRDLALATRVLQELMSDLIREVTAVDFEHSPARGHVAFTGDRTAFDVIIRGRTATGQRAFCAIEIKYSEDLREPAPPRFHERYNQIAPSLVINPDEPALRTPPLQQIFRLHSLSQCMLDRDVADIGVFAFVAPQLNTLAQSAAGAYRYQLLEPGPGQVRFEPIHLERLFEAIFAAGERDLACQLHRRYLDVHLVTGEIELALQEQQGSHTASVAAGSGQASISEPAPTKPGRTRRASPSGAA